ncbi:MAG: ADP-ribosylglycohydrolase family protein [Sphaerochaetaceae bacterium]|nr:ADP-ribosylglycohydrolase family protein [Sphaerochaetaceae bacterium]
MLGAIIGDTVGSRFEWHNIHTKKFEFLMPSCNLTDDSIMTIALAQAIMDWEDSGFRDKNDYSKLSEFAVKRMREFGSLYPRAGYGGHFAQWLRYPDMGPYNSCGNGSAMRVSPVGWAARDLEDCIKMSRAVTEVTHNHPDGIMGAEATAVQIFLARNGFNKEELKTYEEGHYYKIPYDMAYLRKNYRWYSVCDGTCQAAFQSLYEASDFEDSIRNCMCIGGDCDTTGAICGAIAEAVFGIPQEIEKKIYCFMDERQKKVVESFRARQK